MKTRQQAFTILLADSDPDEYYLLRDALEENGFTGELDYVSSRDELMTSLRSDRPPPSLLIMDFLAPGEEGVEALEELHRDPRLRHLPVVMMTVSSTPEDVIQSYTLGARSYIEKPLTFEDQVRTVGILLQYWRDAVVLPNVESAFAERDATDLSTAPVDMAAL